MDNFDAETLALIEELSVPVAEDYYRIPPADWFADDDEPAEGCVQYVNAASADEALRKTKPILGKPAVNEECFE